MPFVHIELLEGRSFEQKKALVKDVTEAIVKHTGVPKEHVHIILRDIKKGDELAEGGEFR